MSRPDPGREQPAEPVVVRDKRRLDPLTGQAREPAPEQADSAPEPEAAPDDTRVSELTETLQRLTAEYANYRKRVERDRVAMVEMATQGLVERLLPLLDDVGRAREHGDLEGAFKTVGENLEAFVERLGVERFGTPGDVFDPQVHEAVMQAPADLEASVPTCAQVFAAGYRFSSTGRVLRPAQVTVAEPGRPLVESGAGTEA